MCIFLVSLSLFPPSPPRPPRFVLFFRRSPIIPSKYREILGKYILSILSVLLGTISLKYIYMEVDKSSTELSHYLVGEGRVSRN